MGASSAHVGLAQTIPDYAMGTSSALGSVQTSPATAMTGMPPAYSAILGASPSAHAATAHFGLAQTSPDTAAIATPALHSAISASSP